MYLEPGRRHRNNPQGMGKPGELTAREGVRGHILETGLGRNGL